jgi:hypothetical protein
MPLGRGPAADPPQRSEPHRVRFTPGEPSCLVEVPGLLWRAAPQLILMAGVPGGVPSHPRPRRGAICRKRACQRESRGPSGMVPPPSLTGNIEEAKPCCLYQQAPPSLRAQFPSKTLLQSVCCPFGRAEPLGHFPCREAFGHSDDQLMFARRQLGR